SMLAIISPTIRCCSSSDSFTAYASKPQSSSDENAAVAPARRSASRTSMRARLRRMRISISFFERVSDASHGTNRPRTAGELELAAQAADVDIDDVRSGIEPVAPDEREQVTAREGAAALLRQREQQIELDAREIQPAALDGRMAMDRVEIDAGHA